LPHWDYGQAGLYYVTICTKNRDHFFGTVMDHDMHLSPVGEIVAEEWVNTGVIRPNIELDTWIIMPNHLHLIVVITHKIESSPVETPRRGVSTNTSAAYEKWAANTLGSIIGQFKGKCTKRIHAEGYRDFAWQARFYDRIIRTEESLNKARQYIIDNPAKWQEDRDNLAGLYM
jgi:REP element-mobilizing transposase RayT